ncbi:hypothetical protein SEMRO_2700_G335050.1 [Seminavis robusta]|uniref:Uncharacterized protein n=1 Tax=Seminavis robusta TaxID=568900 RepID=A0A9N8F2C7_9STRA|nr:hypothetical protein SEMRO_2700_G335050.1 [Seminavis robusta]|eukprot:Sro2700_g335050.1 n/a (482) ;mRNA; r:6671-8116
MLGIINHLILPDLDCRTLVRNHFCHLLAGRKLHANLKVDYDEDSTSSDDNCIEGEAVLNCFFHVMQPFSQRKSYVKKIKNKSFAAPKGTAYGHVSNIARTKSIEQRQTVTQLYLRDWRENRGEVDAADHLEKEYCKFPKWNWNYACSGEVGVYPSNCPNESFNRHGIKSVAADCSKNASLASFLVHTAPRLLQEDANSRNDACTIEIPRTPSKFAVGITGFLRDGIDVVELGRDEFGNASSWLVNAGHRIGIPIDQRRVRLVLAALDGDKQPFEQELLQQKLHAGPEQIANKMVRATESVCHLQWRQGNIVGDCEDCYKHLGYSCPGAIYLRSKHGLLVSKLELLRKTSANARGDAAKASARGNTRQLYQSGLRTKSTKRRCLTKMLQTFDAYLGTLNHGQLARLVTYLRLFRVEEKGKDPIQDLTTMQLLDSLVSFYDNPTGYRAMILGGKGKATTYAVVKQIASNMKKASMPEKENNKE